MFGFGSQYFALLELGICDNGFFLFVFIYVLVPLCVVSFFILALKIRDEERTKTCLDMRCGTISRVFFGRGSSIVGFLSL